MDVLRPSIKKPLRGLVACFMLFNVGCQKKMQSEIVQTSEVETAQILQKITVSNIIIRIENQNKKESKLAEVDFNFYGTDLSEADFEVQKAEIRNLILIHFANADFKQIPIEKSKIKDPKLSVYLNQFLSKGTIEEAEYQLVRVY